MKRNKGWLFGAGAVGAVILAAYVGSGPAGDVHKNNLDNKGGYIGDNDSADRVLKELEHDQDDQATIEPQPENTEGDSSHEKAETLLQKAIAIYEQVFDPNHPTLAIRYNNLAENLRVQGRYDEAEPLYRKAAAGGVNALGMKHPDTQLVINNYKRLIAELPDEPLKTQA